MLKPTQNAIWRSHEWEGIGGCQSNPGVFDTGGTIEYHRACSRCGLEAVSSYGYSSDSPVVHRYSRNGKVEAKLIRCRKAVDNA